MKNSFTKPDHTLAVVIPAFRAHYLGEALESLARQTDQNFSIYIGDDASPEDLVSVIDSFSDRLTLHYHRFQNNLGGSSLTAQWHRCLELCDEPWVWVFSDDDIAHPECVSAFHDALRNSNTHGAYPGLYRFQLDIIDGNNEVIFRAKPHPEKESITEFFQAFLTDRQRHWREQDHIFNREALIRQGGFVDFPKGLYSDYATWLALSSLPGGVQTLPARIGWRAHDASTSAKVGRHRIAHLDALNRFALWLAKWSETTSPETHAIFVRNFTKWWYKELGLFDPPLDKDERAAVAAVHTRITGHSPGPSLRLALSWGSLKPGLRRLPVISWWLTRRMHAYT